MKSQEIIMVLWGCAPEDKVYDLPVYLRSYDPDGNSGWGEIDWTYIRDEALVFDNFEEAIELYRRPSTVLPVRPDGKPNRPLTAFHVEFQPKEAKPL
jgi:hypothetical protein